MRLFWHVFLVCSSCYNKNTTNWVAYKQLIFISHSSGSWKHIQCLVRIHFLVDRQTSHLLPGSSHGRDMRELQDLFHKNGSHLETCFSLVPHEPWAHSLPHSAGGTPLGQVGESIILVCLGLRGFQEHRTFITKTGTVLGKLDGCVTKNPLIVFLRD